MSMCVSVSHASMHISRAYICAGADTGFPEGGGVKEHSQAHTPLGHCLRDVIHPIEGGG